jgi:vacuolar protein sorting-associated protein 13A/C
MGDWLRRAVAEVLERALGTFVEGIDAENLKLDVFGGDVTLQSLRLRLSAFEALGLPVAVADGTS